MRGRLLRLFWWLPFGRVAEVPPSELNEELQSVRPPVLLDVRTRGEWRKGHIAGAVNLPIAELRRGLPGLGLDPQQPVVGLTWQDADAYVDWAELRLPTEAEWEYAAAGGKGFAYPTATGAISHDLANYRGAEGKDGWNVPSPVGSFPPQ